MKGTCLHAHEDKIGECMTSFVLGDIVDGLGSLHVSK